MQILGSNVIFLRGSGYKVIFLKNHECKCSRWTHTNNTTVMLWFAQCHLTSYLIFLYALMSQWDCSLSALMLSYRIFVSVIDSTCSSTSFSKSDIKLDCSQTYLGSGKHSVMLVFGLYNQVAANIALCLFLVFMIRSRESNLY